MFALVVRFAFADEHAVAGFDALVAATLPKIREHEPGTLLYAVHEVEGSPLQRVVYELHRDRAAFQAHEQQPHMKNFLHRRNEYAVAVQAEALPLVDAAGLPR